MRIPVNENDLRYSRTHSAIIESAFSLAEKNGWKKVSVTELTKMANINRNTFYLHYETIEDVFGKFENEIVEEYHKYLENTSFDQMFGTSEYFENFLRKIREKTLMISKIGRTEYLLLKLQNEWMDFFENKYLSDNLTEKEKILFTQYLSGIMFVFFSRWVKDPENTSIKEHFAIGTKLVKCLDEISGN